MQEHQGKLRQGVGVGSLRGTPGWLPVPAPSLSPIYLTSGTMDTPSSEDAW